MTTEKTHYRKAFNSPYLSSADIVEPVVLTIKNVTLETDHTKKTKNSFNTAHFIEKEIRPGEKLKPMILNVQNSKFLKELTDSAFIDDWKKIRVQVFVDPNVKFGRELVEGLRLSMPAKLITKKQLGDLQKLIKSSGADLAGFLKFLNAASLETLPANKFQEAANALKAKLKRKRK